MTKGKIVGTFPFGQPVRLVEQTDRTPKRAFVLGVYSSAVHAKWLGLDGKVRVHALAVASEPGIFWTGDPDETREIVDQIKVPPEAGRLVPAAKNLNGPSGIALDDRILSPLGLSRKTAWLCDLVPHSCANPGQRKAVRTKYSPLVRRLGLPEAKVPDLPRPLADDDRRREILAELEESQAELLILLGDEPIRHFMRPLVKGWTKLADLQPYGRFHGVKLGGRDIQVLPLAHPRQVAKLGTYNKKWHGLHKDWMEQRA